ncbi:PREDICTED: transmembrane protein 223, partial [Ficedula albicollis]|uniref:transmembrane protein 223 n=1 Tax=Ficedula albicollis TaxID=59894 RepID=UPI0007AD7D26
VLFQHDRSRFFRLVGLFCAGQGLFWAYLAHFAFTALRPAPAAGPGPDDPLRPRDNKWRFGFTASCLTVGTGGAGLRSERAQEPGSNRAEGERNRARAAGAGERDRARGSGTGIEPGSGQQDQGSHR